MRIYFIFLCLLFVNLAHAQEFSYPVVKPKGNSFGEFFPKSWTILDSATGDLNKDKLNDAAIVLQYKDTVAIPDGYGDSVVAQPRVLIILFRDSSGGYKLVEQSNTFILVIDNPYSTDPYEDVMIERGVLKIRFQLFGTSITNASYAFRYQQGEFVLIGADKFSVNRADLEFENYSFNFLTKKRSLDTGNEDKGTKNKTQWKPINIPQLKTLKTFRQPMTWEVEEYIYL